MSDVELLKRRFERERNARKQAEALLEQKSLEVYEANQGLKGLADRLREQAEHTQGIVDAAAEGIISYDSDGLIRSFNRSAQRIFRCESAVDCDISLLFDLGETESRGILFPSIQDLEWTEPLDITEDEPELHDPVPITGRRASGKSFSAEVAVSVISTKGKTLYTALIRDLTRRHRLEARLSQAQKMESVGQLAAGIAHEINTPIQFVGDNIQFLEGAFDDLGDLLELYGQLKTAFIESKPVDGLLSQIQEQEELTDLPFLKEEFPGAITQATEGINRVSKIVRAMKEFSQPPSDSRSAFDLNKAICDTLTITSNQACEVAEIETELDETLISMPCLVSQMNQALLNMISNSIEALANQSRRKKGRIQISTRSESDAIEFRICDDGPGIPDSIQSKIFDPFFTTKEVGKGMGQGLAFVYDVIVDKHGGTIQVQSSPGKGTTFVVRLPIPNKTELTTEVRDERAAHAHSAN